MCVKLGPVQGFPTTLSEEESKRRLWSEQGPGVFADNTAALAVETAAVAAAAADAAALAAARAGLGVTSPSELGSTGKDLKESGCVKSSAEEGSPLTFLVP